jgi:hypothetical protein
MVEDINESHVTRWTEMVSNSTPQIKTLYYTAYMDLFTLKKHIVAFPASKLKDIVGYQLRRPHITQELVREIVDKAQAEGTWPNYPPRAS